MKKKIFGCIAVLAIAAVAAWNVSVNFSSQKDELSDIFLANADALAIEISSQGNWTVTILGVHSWRCDSGGKVCCPDFYSESC